MHANQNFWEPVRKYVWPRIHGLLTTIGGYSVGQVSNDQYVGTIPHTEKQVEETLSHRIGFTWNPVAALKREDGEWSEGSWVFRDADDMVFWDGKAKYKHDFLTDKQLHVTLFDGEDGIDVYAHFEYSWITHPVKHLNTVDMKIDLAVAMTTRRLEESGIRLDG